MAPSTPNSFNSFTATDAGLVPNARMPSFEEAQAKGAKGEYGPLWIRAAALRKPDGTILEGRRHAELVPQILEEGKVSVHDCTHGFVTNSGVFVSRSLAAALAVNSGQVREGQVAFGKIHSHDLWECFSGF